jgi:beta-N-acetylhexosaminidase
LRLAEAALIPSFPGHSAPRWILAALERGLAGVTLFGPNVVSPEQVAALTASLRSAGAEPVIAIDEEGGDVTRIAHLTGSPYPGNAALGVVDDAALTAGVYQSIGRDLAGLGINVDLAPCVDVLSASGNPVVGSRSFGASPDLVARHAVAAVTGLQSAGVAACAKHFPGHGSTRTDTHEAIATIEGGLAVLRSRDLPPFSAAIAAGVLAVMPGHLRVPELTGELPATLSSAALSGLLRGELGFKGVIISDALEMRAVSDSLGVPEAAVLVMAAGADLLCLGRDAAEDAYMAVRAALAEAVRGGRVAAEHLEEAAARVALLREWLTRARVTGAAGTQTPVDMRASALATDGVPIGLRAARRAVRLHGKPPILDHPVVFEAGRRVNIAVGAVPWGLGPWAPPPGVRRIGVGSPGTDIAAVAAGILAEASGRSLVLVVRDAHQNANTQALVTAVLAGRPDTVLVEMGLPAWRPADGTYGAYLATYGASRANAQAAAELLGLTRPQERRSAHTQAPPRPPYEGLSG